MKGNKMKENTIKKILTISALAAATQLAMADIVAIVMNHHDIHYTGGDNDNGGVVDPGDGDNNPSPVDGVNHPWLLFAQSQGQLTSKNDVSAYEDSPANFNNIMGHKQSFGDIDLPQYDIGVKNIHSLNFAGNVLTHINFINGVETINAGSGVSYLDFQRNLINDISGLNDLISVDDNGKLNLSSNKITNIDALSNLTYANDLDFSYNNISDISSLSNVLKIGRFNFSNNNISDMSPLKNALIGSNGYVTLNFNSITDINMLNFDNQNLKELHINNNKLSDVSVISDMRNLTTLNISNNNISDLSYFDANNRSLSALYAYGNQLTNLKGLENIREMSIISIGGNPQLDDLSAIKNMTKIDNLSINSVSPNLKNLDDLENITELKSLNSDGSIML